MGCSASIAAGNYQAAAGKPETKSKTYTTATTGFGAIPDQYRTLEEVSKALRAAGLESSQLVVGVDFTKSNTWTGEKSFGGNCLHSLKTGTNPYHEVLSTIAEVLRDFDDDNLIPAYGFGDTRSKDRKVFSFQPGNAPCDGLGDCLGRYAAVARTALLSGPTSLAPLIRQAVSLVRETGEYHILLIVADGQVDRLEETVDAIVEASNYPLSIVMIGVGDGPWDTMEEFDDGLPARRFDNFQFVDFNSICEQYPKDKRGPAFATHALMEVPDQYKAVKELGLLKDDDKLRARRFKPVADVLEPPPQSLDGICMEPEGEWHVHEATEARTRSSKQRRRPVGQRARLPSHAPNDWSVPHSPKDWSVVGDRG